LSTFDYTLLLTLDIPFSSQFQLTIPLPDTSKNALMTAIRHQYIIGWDNFAKGYTSIYWKDLFQTTHSQRNSPIIDQGGGKMVAGVIALSRQIWNDRNANLHGTTKLEASQKVRECVTAKVRKNYLNPPKLHKRFAKIKAAPLQIRLSRNTTNLQRWLSRISHQKRVSQFIFTNSNCGQMSLRESFRRASILNSDYREFPP
jgi:hypothetical protein